MMISKYKMSVYFGLALIVTLWWAMFAAATNWWIGLILAVCLVALQEIVRKNVKIQ